jgi:diguanylate cyclase (GGDEF)-like protein/PAS domain S-box-containing protein
VREHASADDVLRSAALPLIATDLHGTITLWNTAAERLLGWTATEMVGMSLAVITPDERRGEFAAVVALIRRGDAVAPLDTVRLARDREVNARLQLSPVYDDEGDLAGVSMVALENLEELETRKALAASEARYRTLVQALTEFVVVTNTYGRVMGAQPSWQRYTGQSAEAAAALGWREALHPEDRAILDAQWDRRVVLRTPFSFGARVHNAETEGFRQCQCRAAPIRDGLGRVIEWVIAVTDVHARHTAEERERQTADRFRRIFDANVFGICYGEGRVVYDANDTMLEIIGAAHDDLDGGIPLERLMPPPLDPDARAPFGDGETGEYEIRRLDGGFGYVVAAGVDMAPDGGWLAVAVDVTQRKVAEREIEHRAMHDQLTGLPNRRLLVDRLEHALARASRQGALVGLLFCDLDYFKDINDAYGHACGDAALASVAQRLEGVVREGDTVARTGGDEFVIVLEDLVEAVEAARIAERVRGSLLEPVEWEGNELHVTCSIGVTTSAGHEDPVEDLLNRADDAMYLAKQMGRDQVAFGTDSIKMHSRRRLVERELRRALVDESFELEFQPVIDLRDGGRPVGAEALLRWKIEGELMPTEEVIAVAEDSDIITRISDWVIWAACREFAAWRAEHPEAAEWQLHVNISARDLADDDVVQRVLDGIERGGLAPSDVCVEITESAMLFDHDGVAERLLALRAAGVIVAIDDFGTGYASLGVLRDVPADIVKIDRAFVHALGESERDRAIVQHAIDLAHRLGLVVVGEGVETLTQLSILDDLGCDRVQGHAFSAPKPLADLTI